MSNLSWKVCGMKHSQNIREAAALAPNYMGFIFYPPSPRFVGDDLDQDLLLGLPNTIKKVGVFVNQDTDEIQRRADFYQLDLIQLHGDETPMQCREIKDLGVGVVKAFRLDQQFDFSKLSSYASSVDYFLFDSPGQYFGGNGKLFDWGLLNHYDLDVPFFLSGGIDLDTIGGLTELTKHHLHSIDVNSKFETGPGLKNIFRLGELSKIISQVSINIDNT